MDVEANLHTTEYNKLLMTTLRTGRVVGEAVFPAVVHIQGAEPFLGTETQAGLFVLLLNEEDDRVCLAADVECILRVMP